MPVVLIKNDDDDDDDDDDGGGFTLNECDTYDVDSEN